MAEPFIYPFMRYEKCREAIDWLCEAFGFEQMMVVPGEGDDIAHAVLRLGSGIIMLGTGNSPKTRGRDHTEKAEQGLYVYVPDVDAHYERSQSEGARIVMEINDAFYGFRRYEALDPEGNRWHFAEPLTSVEQRRARS